MKLIIYSILYIILMACGQNAQLSYHSSFSEKGSNKVWEFSNGKAKIFDISNKTELHLSSVYNYDIEDDKMYLTQENTNSITYTYLEEKNKMTLKAEGQAEIILIKTDIEYSYLD